MRYTEKMKPKAMQGIAFSWSSQAVQYEQQGPPGIEYRRYMEGDIAIDCLLARAGGGRELVGILNFYPQDVREFEKAGNFNIWVKPIYQGMGIGTALVMEADKRWDLDLDQQRWSAAGKRLRMSVIRKHKELTNAKHD